VAGQDGIMQIQFVTRVLRHADRGAKNNTGTSRSWRGRSGGGVFWYGKVCGVKSLARRTTIRYTGACSTFHGPENRDRRLAVKGAVWVRGRCGTDAVVARVRQRGAHDDRATSHYGIVRLRGILRAPPTRMCSILCKSGHESSK